MRPTLIAEVVVVPTGLPLGNATASSVWDNLLDKTDLYEFTCGVALGSDGVGGPTSVR